MQKKKFSSQKIAPYLFVAPFVITFLVFSLYPFVSAVVMSFQQVNGFQDATFVGLKNYRTLFQDGDFYAALWNVARYTFWTLLILIPLPMLVAYVLNQKGIPFKGFFRSVYFVPVLTSSVIAGLIFRYAFSSEKTGVFNQWLSVLHIGPVDWLNSPHTAMFALVIIAVWRWLGTNMIYFLSGLQGISPELYESASMDGANSWQKFWFVTIPMLKPITIYVLTISIMAGFSLFNESYVYWGAQSPNNVGTTLVTLIYKAAFTNGNFGYSCTLGVALFVIVVVVNLIQTRIMGLFRD
ncbi:carbohydrate ABC transporter permease [Lacticaseibacillus nasuensis]|uniref:Sugar ABC transporter permease n=2 Tax=Lacticaseibacillus TaxID=2759736 RepID=A0A0R1JGU0_9LACO|nr:sugar ABC transporter permease [Lacticaseibacillus nasuensis]KRK70495.1 sugar ABC transporter permease [Lacticaseibacillus nasuensis JCM 17158]